MGFSFDSENHVYKYGKKTLPSVTQIISGVGLTPDPRFYEPIHAQRGSAVHKAIALFVNSNLNEDSLHEMIKPYFEGFKKFMAESRFKPLVSLCEKPMRSARYQFAGTPDLVGTLNGCFTLIDAKTGDASGWASYQTAAYEILLRELTGRNTEKIKRYGLRLFNDGKYKLIEHSDSNDRNIFLCALTVFKAQKNGGKLNDNYQHSTN